MVLEENPDKFKKRPVRRAPPVSSGGVVRRVAPVSPGVGVRPVQQAGRGVPVRQGYLRSQASVGRVSSGVGVRPVQQVRRVAPVSSGGVAVRRAPAVKSRAPLSNVRPGNVPVGRRPQQSPVRRVVPVSPGVGVRPVQQVRRAVPVRRVPVTSSLSPLAGRAVQDNGLGIIPPVKKVSGSKFGVFKNFFGGVRGRFEDVLDNFDGVGDVFDSFKERFEGVQGVMGFLIVHWWAILVVLGVIGILTFSGFVGISSLKQECTFSLSVDCLDHSVKKDSIELLIKNVAERNIIVKNIKVRSDALEGFSGSDSGICELALNQRGRDLKKNQKYLFQLNVRPAVSLSAAAPNDDNGFGLLADSVMLARAQPSGHMPNLIPTVESVECTARNAARSHISSISDRRVRSVLSHYTDLVVRNTTDQNPEQGFGGSSSRAADNAYRAKESIVNAVRVATLDIYSQARKNVPVPDDPTEGVLQAIDDAVDDFSGSSGTNPIKYQAALYVKTYSGLNRGLNAAKMVSAVDKAADRYIATATDELNGITEVARGESNRRIDIAGVKREVRDYAEYYSDDEASYFAADFVADAVEQASDVAEIRETAIAKSKSINRALTGYYLYHAGLSRIFSHPRYIRLSQYVYEERSFIDYITYLEAPDKSGPVILYYHNLIMESVHQYINDTLRPIVGAEDPNLSSNNPSLNHELNDKVYFYYSDLTSDFTTSGKITASSVHNSALRLTIEPTLSSVIQSAKDEAHHVVNTGFLKNSGNFVNARITGSSESAVISNIEVAVREAIQAVTEGARHVADEAERVYRAGPTTPGGDPVADIKNYVSQNYPSSHIAHDAAVFIVESDISGSDAGVVADNVDRIGGEILTAVTLAVETVSQVAYERSCLDCSAYCFDSFCEYFDPTISYDVKLIPWCSQYERYCENYPDNCVGCGSSGDTCSSDDGCCGNLVCVSRQCQVASSCGSVGEVCCSSGRACVSGFECVSGTCEVPVVCGSEGQACCTSGRACVSGFECVSGTCEVPVVCGSEGQSCCSSGRACVSGFVCGTSGVCEVPVVCGSEGQACCTSGVACVSGFVCGTSGVCEVPVVCGSEGQACCTSGVACVSGFVCGTSGVCEVPVVCGSEGQVCCTSGVACVSGFECVSGTCEAPCGAEDQACCTSGTECAGDLVCADSGTGSTCQPCGSGGQVCCGGRACDEDFECTGPGEGMCVGACGSQGQECCPGDTECGRDLACVVSGEGKTCQSCGQKDEVCCATGNQCSGSDLECVSGTCVEAEVCGSEDQVCCSSGTACVSGFECESGTCREIECGFEDQVCCAADTCGSGLECVSGMCVEAEVCGSEGKVCCSRNRCDSGLECESGTCREIECGYEDQDCCSVSTCASGLECRLGTCKGVKCGSEGSVCCRGGKCDSDLECVDNLCEMPEVQIEFVQHFSLGTLTPGLNESLTVTEPGILFSSIKFAVSVEVRDAELNVTSRSELPAGISGGPAGMQSYGYVTIASEDIGNEGVSGVYVEFSVDKDFFSGFSPSQIRFFEYNQETQAWNKLDDPVHLSEDKENHYFSVVAEDLVGDFAIALEKFVSCAHKDVAESRSRYSIELIYSWEDSPTVNHKVVGELSGSPP